MAASPPCGPSRRKLPADRRGGASLEFAVVGLPFLTLLIFLIELGYDFFAQIALDYGVQTAARSIQVGTAQGANTATLFRSNYLCPALDGLIPCTSVTVNVHPVTTDYYTSVPSGLPSNGTGQLDLSSFNYCPGKPNQLMLMQAVYTSPSLVANFVPGMAANLGSGPVRVTLSSTAFINENYPVTAATAAGC